jgi:hypothetical protein
VNAIGGLSLAGWAVLSLLSFREKGLLPVLGAAWAWQWLLFLSGLWMLAGLRRPASLKTIVLWAVLFRLCGLAALPILEDDYYRFLWDGRQSVLTGTPYATAPEDHFNATNLPDRFAEILDHVNYPSVPTIYGPVCQYAFAACYLIAPGQLWPWKALLVLVDVGVLVLVSRVAGHAFGSAAPTLAAFVFGWCPLTVFETSFNAHPDILGILFVLAALLMRFRGLAAACGMFCGLALGAKVFGLLLVPFLLVRSAKGWGAFAATAAALYAPFWMQGSLAELAGLASFARDWEFNSSLFGLLQFAAGSRAARLICSLGFAVFALALFVRWCRTELKTPCALAIPPGTLLFGAFFLCSPAVNAWYLLWLAPFVALKPGPAGLSALALVSVSYVTGLSLGDPALDNFEHPAWVRPLEYGGVALAGAVQLFRAAGYGCRGRRQSSRPAKGSPESHPRELSGGNTCTAATGQCPLQS